jgi:hypothetical protein
VELCFSLSNMILRKCEPLKFIEYSSAMSKDSNVLGLSLLLYIPQWDRVPKMAREQFVILYSRVCGSVQHVDLKA